LSAFESAAFNNCELHVYGNPTQSPKIDIRLAASARRNSSIKLLGTFPTAEIYRRLAKIDILVLPSTWAENSPLVLLNALASRTMVVVSDVEGMAELVSEGNAGHLVRPSDPAHLAKTLLSLVQDRSTLAAWQATLKKAYTTSPLDYAGEIDILYKTKIASAPRANYQRHTFPSHVSQPVIFTCTPLSEVVDMTNLSQIGWERLAGHHTTFASSPAGLELHTTSKQAHLIFESPHAEKSNIEITFDVLWPEAGLTVIYYGTKMHPEFGEERKLTRHVPANTWCRIHINPGTAKTHVTRLRWDPLFNAPHAKIFVANLELNSSAKHA
jgi:hypothetical protein